MVRPAKFTGENSLVPMNIQLPYSLRERARIARLNISEICRDAIVEKLNGMTGDDAEKIVREAEEAARVAAEQAYKLRAEFDTKTNIEKKRTNQVLELQILEQKWSDLNLANREAANAAYSKFRFDEKFNTLPRVEKLKAWIAAAEAAP